MTEISDGESGASVRTKLNAALAVTDAVATDIAAAISNHEAAANPHSIYLTQTEADALYGKHNFTASAAPTVNDDSGDGYAVGSLWLWAARGLLWQCVDATAGAAVWALPNVNHSGLLKYRSGVWYHALLSGNPIGGAAMATDTIHLVWHPLDTPITVSDFGARLTTAAAGGNIKLGAYANNPATGRPTGAPLAETASISTASAVNVSDDITGANVTLYPPGFWAAFWQDNNTSAVQVVTRDAFNDAAKRIGGAQADISNNTNRGGFLLTAPATFGSWPDLTSATFTVVNSTSLSGILQLKAA